VSIPHPRNQQRFRFQRRGESTLAGRRVVEIEYREVSRPTLARTFDGGNFECRGSFWVTPVDGAIVRSEVRYEALPGRIRVDYRFEPRIDAFVPAEMSEQHGGGNTLETIRGTARYTDYVRGDAEIGPIQYKR
jgi:hypothetical protein